MRYEEFRSRWDSSSASQVCAALQRPIISKCQHRHIDNFWIMRNLQNEFDRTGCMVWIELGCTYTKRSNTYTTGEWRRLRSACTCTFDTSLRKAKIFYLFCFPKTLTCGNYDQTRLTSLRINAVIMVHLYCRSLVSPETCMCEKEVIRTAFAYLIDRCGELRDLSRFSAGLLT